MRTKNRLGRALALTTVVGAMASVAGFMPSVANADTQTGQTITVTSGNASTSFSMGLTSPNNVCQGNTALDNYQWGMYVASSAVDLNAVTVSGGALAAPSGYVSTLFSAVGENPQVDLNLSTIGQITGTTNVNLAVSGIPAAGTYRIGYYCSQAGQETRHWITPITVSSYVSPTNFAWAFGAVPSAPAPLTAVGGNAQITGTITAVTATPAVTSYTVTATPTSGAPVSVTVPAAGPYTYTIPGLTNGTQYSVTAIATNTVGASTPVAPPILVTPALPALAAPAVSVASGPSPVTVSWALTTGVPLAGATLVNHVVTFTPVGSAAPIAAITVAGPATSTSVTGAAGDGYTISVVGNYSNGQVTAAGTGAFSFTNAQVVVQDITVVRPQGALVLTQRCGVHGSAPEYTNSVFGPTFPALDQTAGADPTGVAPNVLPPAAVGTAPIADSNATTGDPNSFGTGPVGPVGNTTPAGSPDGLFGQYPYPVDANGNAIATYATNCAVNLGTARLITSGPNAGAYFRATGQIAQLTVVDTRNTDSGWTLNGRMGDFFLAGNTAATEKFSGNLLGWVPEVTWDSNPNLDGYNMTVAAGSTRLPVSSTSNAGLGAQDPLNTALANSLAKANALNTSTNTGGLGMAVMDARINLLIPVNADAGTYKGVLTFTIV